MIIKLNSSVLIKNVYRMINLHAYIINVNAIININSVKNIL